MSYSKIAIDMMKMKPTKICKRKGCNNEFKAYRSTDKYCSPACAYADQKERPKKKQKPVKKVSDKRKQESYLYTKKRKVFLSLPENQFCPVTRAAYKGLIDISEFPEDQAAMIQRNKGTIFTDQVHHKAGRRGKFLNYVPLWLAVSDMGHKWIHAHPKKAYELEFLKKSSTINLS